MKIRIRILSVLAPLIALFTAVLICSAILNFIDRDPVETFRSMFEYGTSGKSIVSIMERVANSTDQVGRNVRGLQD